MKKTNVKMDNEVVYKRKRVGLLIMFFAIFVIGIVLYNTYNRVETYLVNEGVIEYTTAGIGYIIKNETVMEVDNTKVLIPTKSEGSRVSKNNIIATYRGSEYEEYQSKMQEIDNKILDAMGEIDIEYSIEVSKLEAQVLEKVINARKVTSMIEMQEIKNDINDLLDKRANIIGELSPEEAYVKELIANRKALEAELKNSSANVTANIGGIISYNIDGLEDKLTIENIMNLNYEDVKGYVNDSSVMSNNKIKITSNYEAYILVRVDNVDNNYINEGEKYKLKVMSNELTELVGTIVKSTETEQGYEVLFRITNGIENIIENRECEIEVVWTTYEGLVVPINAIKEDEQGKKYVTIITRGDYIDIPVIKKRENNTYAIVENYEKENINDYILERYDQVVVGAK